MFNKRLYGIYTHMKQRCENENDTAYKYYGGKGVCICPEWKEYKNFKKWAYSNGYEDSLTIDRIDSSGNYEPSNCRWITRRENTINSNVGKKMNKKTKEALLKSRIGAKHTEKTRKKISVIHSKWSYKEREEMRADFSRGISRGDIMIKYKTSSASLSRILNGDKNKSQL
jgi:hypothetical protein